MRALEIHVSSAASWLRAAKGSLSVAAMGPPGEAVPACLKSAGLTPRAWLRPSVRIQLSSSLARPFLAGPVQGLSSWQEASIFAAAAAPGATGIEGPCAVTLESWPGDSGALATATALALLQRLQETVRSHGGNLVSVRPAWAWPFNRVLSTTDGKPALTVLEDNDGAVMLAASGGSVEVAMSIHPRPTLEETQTCVARLALSHDWHGKAPGRWTWRGANFGAADRGWSSLPRSEEAS